MIRDAVLADLRAAADPVFRDSVAELYRTDVSHYLGVRTPTIRKLSAMHYKSLAKASLEEVIAAGEELLGTGLYEGKIIAFDWLDRRRKQLEPQHLAVCERWLVDFVDDWMDCDDLCLHAVGYLLTAHPELLTTARRWTESPHWWVRRAAAVGLIYGLRRGVHRDAAFETAQRLLDDEILLVQKGYGWTLKECARHFEDELVDFLLAQRSNMPRLALRYAAEKLPPAKQRRVLSR